jgi:ribosomal protein S18 acetylase RimI-like enzyme
MAIDLQEAPPTPVWPEGITVRTFVPGQDEFDTYTVEDESFRDHWGYNASTFEQWKQNEVGSVHFDPTLTFLAYEGNRLAGIALCENWLGIGNVNTLGVRRPWRKKGLGLALLYHAFGAFYERGIHQVKLYVDTQNLTGATRLYERASMHAEQLLYEYEKELRSGKETGVR